MELHLNDFNKKAVALIKKNLKLNRLKAKVTNFRADECLIKSGYFDYIDIDPFGSPNPYLEASIKRLADSGILSVTATDCGALYGTYPEAGFRKYHSWTAKTSYSHELGIRILIKHVIETGAEHETALRPILSHQTLHYFRAYFIANRGVGKCDELLKEIKFFVHCDKCLRRKVVELPIAKCECGNNLKVAGPLYTGDIQNTSILKKMKEINNNPKLEKFLDTLIEESKIHAVGFYSMPDIASMTKKALSKMDITINRLKKKGYKASRTHIEGQGVKTDAKYEDILEAN